MPIDLCIQHAIVVHTNQYAETPPIKGSNENPRNTLTCTMHTQYLKLWNINTAAQRLETKEITRLEDKILQQNLGVLFSGSYMEPRCRTQNALKQADWQTKYTRFVLNHNKAHSIITFFGVDLVFLYIHTFPDPQGHFC